MKKYVVIGQLADIGGSPVRLGQFAAADLESAIETAKAIVLASETEPELITAGLFRAGKNYSREEFITLL